MLTSKLAVSVRLRFLVRTQSRAPGEAERGRLASARPKLTLRRTTACMLPSSRQRPHSVPNHRHKVSRERYGSGQNASTAGPTPAKAEAGGEISWGGRARSPSSEGAQSLDSGTSSAPASPGEGVGHPAARGRALTLRQAPRVLIGWSLLSWAVIGLAPTTLPLHLGLRPGSAPWRRGCQHLDTPTLSKETPFCLRWRPLPADAGRRRSRCSWGG